MNVWAHFLTRVCKNLQSTSATALTVKVCALHTQRAEEGAR